MDKLRLSRSAFTSKVIKSKISSEGKSATELFQIVLDQDRKIKQNTKDAIKTMVVRLDKFSPGLPINQIDYQFAKDFEKWLLKVPSRTGGTLNINTVNKYLRDLERMLTACLKYEYIDKNRLKGYDHIKEPKGSYKKRDSVTTLEVEFLETVDLSERYSGQKLESMRYTLDMFLFSVYTGLRIGDLMRVCPNWLKDGMLKFKTQKGEGKDLEIHFKKLFGGKGYLIFEKYARYKLGNTPLFGDSIPNHPPKQYDRY